MDTSFRNIDINDFDYGLEDKQIAKYPLEKRDESKLLCWKDGVISDLRFRDVSSLLPQNSTLIYNNTKVFKARLFFRKETGATIEIFCLEPHHPADYESIFSSNKSCRWACMIGNKKKWKHGKLRADLEINNKKIAVYANRQNDNGGYSIIDFSWEDEGVYFSDILETFGVIPIPPYLSRESEESDLKSYQTVYSMHKGSVAAPTAGLHFTEDVLRDIDQKGIGRECVTLHVGAGTFKPVDASVASHDMHTEHYSVDIDFLERLRNKSSSTCAVGTTTVRTLESLYWLGVKISKTPNITEAELYTLQWEPYEQECKTSLNDSLSQIILWMKSNKTTILNASTQIMIVPGYKFKVIDILITNFHQPKSTLLLLVSAFTKNNWKEIYKHAMTNEYRFLSYGDSSILWRKN
ncbi:MAG: S-adenosylmethionine:tRNA ribosyltransferase-isomerase [Bacteroidales bacterium]